MFDMKNILGQVNRGLSYRPDDRFILPSCRVGLELEIENVPRFSREMRDQFLEPYWDIKEEGSLRNNGREFVLRTPLFGEDLHASIMQLTNMIAQTKKNSRNAFQKSPRTSFHVHVDMSDVERSDQLFSFLALYLALERPLFKYFGDSREGNIFCLPLYRSPHAVETYRAFLADDPREANSILQHGRRERMPRRNRNRARLIDNPHSIDKYSALNIRPLTSLGSVEFRHAPALTTTEEIVDWVNIILAIKKAGLERNYLEDKLANQFSDVGPDRMIQEIMGPELMNKLDYPEFNFDVMRGIRLCQNIHLASQAQEFLEKIEEARESASFFESYL